MDGERIKRDKLSRAHDLRSGAANGKQVKRRKVTLQTASTRERKSRGGGEGIR